MPARVLDGRKHPLPRFAVIGQYDHVERHAVVHVGLLAKSDDVSSGQEVAVHHQGPTLFTDAERGPRMRGHVAAWHPELTPERVRAIDAWMKRMPVVLAEAKNKWRYYSLRRGDDEVRDTGVTLPRFSCASFVTTAYAQAKLALVVDDHVCPAIAEDEFRRIWYMLPAERVATAGYPPFRVLLPGYLMHALARADHTLHEPYAPSERDLHYPHPPEAGR